MCGAALRYRRDLPPGRSTTAARAPVVLVHGFARNPSAWHTLADHLRAEGFGDLRAVRYAWRDDVPTIAHGCGPGRRGHGRVRCRRRARACGGPQPGWGHGAVLARRARRRRPARPPWSPSPRRTGGTPWTRLPVHGPGHDLHEGSAVSRRLAASRCPHDRWTTIGGTYDMVVPGARQRLPGSAARRGRRGARRVADVAARRRSRVHRAARRRGQRVASPGRLTMQDAGYRALDAGRPHQRTRVRGERLSMPTPRRGSRGRATDGR